MAYPAITVVNFLPTALALGAQPFTTTSTTQAHPLGTRARGLDSGTAACGEAEFIYLKGVASTAAGDVVTYDAKAGTTTRGVAGGRGVAAVAMSANVASQYGWYAVFGVVPVAAGTVAAAKPGFFTATAGTIDDAVVTGDKIDGLVTQAADSAGFAYCCLAYPAAGGNG